MSYGVFGVDKKPAEFGRSSECLCRGGQIRTDDFLLPKQARYQAAPRPDTLIISYN